MNQSILKFSMKHENAIKIKGKKIKLEKKALFKKD